MLIDKEKLREIRRIVRYLNMKLKAWKDVLVERQILSPISYNLGHSRNEQDFSWIGASKLLSDYGLIIIVVVWAIRVAAAVNESLL